MLRFLLSFLLLLLLPSTGMKAQEATASVPFDTLGQEMKRRLDAITTDELLQRSQLGLYVYDLAADRSLYTYGHRQRMRPASTMKVITAIVALDKLGGDYRYHTRFYTTAPLDSIVRGHLIIHGGFDPLFSHDDLGAIISILRNAGVRRIEGNILLDLSMKDANLMGWGWCWDDNTVPLNPLLYRGEDHFIIQLEKVLAEAGITLEGNIHEGVVTGDAELLLIRTHSIQQVLVPMMKRSDNLFAESLFYQIAASAGKLYAGRSEAVKVMEDFVRKIGLSPDHYQFADGSGLSLYNYVSPELLVAALRYAYRHEAVFNSLVPSLPVMGRDGTLRKRCLNSSAQNRVWAKTGTVDGVSSLAGYATAPNGHLLAFAIINQGIAKAAIGRRFQNRVCKALTAPYNALIPAPVDNSDEDEDEALPTDTLAAA